MSGKNFALDDDSVVVVVGSGAGGGTLSAELTRLGANVVCLEAGEPARYEQNLPAFYARTRWSDPRSFDGDLYPDLPVLIAKAVGGTTNFWGGVSLRRQAHEMRSRTTYGAVPGTSLVDWPITLEDLEPWYAQAEQRMGVSGLNGKPDIPDHNNSELLKIGARRRGYQRVSNGHMAINTVPHDGRPACRQMGFCTSGCLIGAKWSSTHAEIPRALATGRFELRQQCHATKIEHDTTGRVTGVVYKDAEGREQRQRARVVCVAANGIETPRLLLLSASGRFPQGLANGADQVGRHYMTDLIGRVIGVLPGEVHNYRGSTNSGLVADDMAHDPARGFAGGFVYVSRGIQAPSWPNEIDPAGYGTEFAKLMEAYPNAVSAAVLGEDMPVADNRITLDDTLRDAHGLPVARVTKRYHANDLALMDYALNNGVEIFKSLGASFTLARQSRTVIHNLGTCRMSADPAEGVCDRFGRAHELPNLFISDGSQFPTSAAGPPTLTIVTLALRQAAHIVGAMQDGRI